MPEHDFELYLSLLSRLLRLSPGQREEIADELRDHLEERLAELAAAGVPREDAVPRALQEFGDAASLAADFRHISKLRTRRLLMRWTLGTTVFAALIAVLASAFWPQPPGAPAPQRAEAQGIIAPGGLGGGPGGVPGRRVVRSTAGNPAQYEELERKLSQRLENVKWEDVPVGDLIQQISREIKADIVIDKEFFEQFEENGYVPQAKVTLTLGFSKITARTALELILERGGYHNAAVTYRDGLIYLTSRDNDRYVEVYNCRDLLASIRGKAHANAMAMQGAAGMGEGDMSAGGRPGFVNPMGAGAMPGGMEGGMMPPGGRARVSPNAAQLIAVLQATIRSTPWMTVDGTGASVAEYNGLLVINAGHEAHREISQLLERMRAANREEAKPKAKRRPAGSRRNPSGKN